MCLKSRQYASPTLSNEAFSVVLQDLASFQWQLSIANKEGAFLQGDKISRQNGKILVRIPKDGVPGHGQDTVCELVKRVYGLVDASGLWWNSLTKVLTDIGMIQSQLDSCLFYSREIGGKLDGVIAFHVDDLVSGGSPSFLTDKFQKLKARYPFKHVTHGEGKFLGKMLKQAEDLSITIEQQECAETLQCIPISKERRKEKESETNAQDKTQMRGVLGEVQWLVTGSRPDLAARCSLMQQQIATSTVNDLVEINLRPRVGDES